MHHKKAQISQKIWALFIQNPSSANNFELLSVLMNGSLLLIKETGLTGSFGC